MLSRRIEAECYDETMKSRTPATIRPKTALEARQDRWVNESNRFGSRADPMTRTTFHRDIAMDRGLLDAIYRHDWLTRRIVDIPAEDAIREWVRFLNSDQKKIQAAEHEIERLNIRERAEELIRLSRLYGGAVMILGAWDGRDPSEPLGNVRQVLFVDVVDRYLAYPLTFYKNPRDPKYGQTETYQVSRPSVIGAEVSTVHETRVVRMNGNYLPPLERIRNFTFGASVVESLLEAARQFGVVSQAMASVCQDFITKKLKVQDLANLLQTEDGRNNLFIRLGELAAGMSIHGIATFGADEEFDKMGTPITGLPDLFDRFVEMASAASGIPRSRLFNNMSGKLGGDAGQNDLIVHYDNIAAFQKNRFNSSLRRIFDVCFMPLGIEPGGMEYEFNSLWQLSSSDQADVELKIAQKDQIYITTGVVEPEEVALTRFSGDGVNLTDMNIVVDPRKKFLAEFKKAEPRSTEPPPNEPGGNGLDKSTSNLSPDGKQSIEEKGMSH